MEVFFQGENGVIFYQGRLCVPDVGELRLNILAEAHNYRYIIHQVPLRCTEIYGKSIGGMT